MDELLANPIDNTGISTETSSSGVILVTIFDMSMVFNSTVNEKDPPIDLSAILIP
jgi:hypothetical protein